MRDKALREILSDRAQRYIKEFKFFPNERQLLKKVKKLYSISVVTTCMGRLCDIKKTYIQNIKSNLNYQLVEFVLINYNSGDGLNEWVKENLSEYIDMGVLSYYKTVEDFKYFSLCHSKNLGFKLAKGEIVNNVDADHFTTDGFVERVNLIANQTDERKIVFMKSRQKNRGRLGFYKDEFINTLGGYDENLTDYGHEDPDLLQRAVALGFKCWRFGGQYCNMTPDHVRHPYDNYENKDWKYTQRRNTLISILNLVGGYYKANRLTPWGNATVIKNFSEEVVV